MSDIDTEGIRRRILGGIEHSRIDEGARDDRNEISIETLRDRSDDIVLSTGDEDIADREAQDST